MRQFSGAARRAEEGIDALTAYQVDERRALTPPEIVERYARAVPRAVRGRRRRSALLGRVALPEKQVANGAEETWTFGYLFATILTRDTWMHRVDTAAATGQPLVLTAEHDGIVVADIVSEWLGRHGAPCRLDLTGPPGGSWSVGGGGEALTADAVLFARTVSGRVPGQGLLAVQVPF
jgi:hypothetical protein